MDSDSDSHVKDSDSDSDSAHARLVTGLIKTHSLHGLVQIPEHTTATALAIGHPHYLR